MGANLEQNFVLHSKSANTIRSGETTSKYDEEMGRNGLTMYRAAYIKVQWKDPRLQWENLLPLT